VSVERLSILSSSSLAAECSRRDAAASAPRGPFYAAVDQSSPHQEGGRPANMPCERHDGAGRGPCALDVDTAALTALQVVREVTDGTPYEGYVPENGSWHCYHKPGAWRDVLVP